MGSKDRHLTIFCSTLIVIVDFDQPHCCFLQTDPESFVKEIVGHTSGFMLRDVCALIADVGASLFPKSAAAVDKVRTEDVDGSLSSKAMQDSNDREVSPQVPGKEDLTKALDRSRKRNAAALGAPKVN